MKVLIPYGLFVDAQALDEIRKFATLARTRDLSQDALLVEAADADVIFAGPATRLDRNLIESSPALKLIARVGVGVDCIDLKAATERGVFVTNSPAIAADSVAEFTIALLISLAKNIPRCDRAVRDGRWVEEKALLCEQNIEFHRKTHGIVGMGAIGSRAAAMCRGLGMKVLYYKRNRSLDLEQSLGVEYAPFERLIREADTISLHTPLNAETENLFAKPQFEAMKRTALLINQSRGRVVNEKALIQALQDGTIAGYATDVYDEEPPGPDNELLKLRNVVLAPHMGALTREARARVGIKMAERVLAVARGGVPENVVNKDVLQRIKGGPDER